MPFNLSTEVFNFEELKKSPSENIRLFLITKSSVMLFPMIVILSIIFLLGCSDIKKLNSIFLVSILVVLNWIIKS